MYYALRIVSDILCVCASSASCIPVRLLVLRKTAYHVLFFMSYSASCSASSASCIPVRLLVLRKTAYHILRPVHYCKPHILGAPSVYMGSRGSDFLDG